MQLVQSNSAAARIRTPANDVLRIKRKGRWRRYCVRRFYRRLCRRFAAVIVAGSALRPALLAQGGVERRQDNGKRQISCKPFPLIVISAGNSPALSCGYFASI